MIANRQLTPAVQEALGRIATKAVEGRMSGHGRPFVVGCFVTNRCNCKCESCLWRHNDWQDTPTADLKRFFGEARDEGFVAVAITGGEPFLRKDLGELVAHIKGELGMPILLFTTGWFLQARHAEVLPHIDMLVMSLDSARAERHDAIRGLRGLFDRVMAGADLVREQYPHLSWQFNCCVQNGVEEEVDDLIALAVAKETRISFDVITEFRNGEDSTHFTETGASLPPDALKAVCARLLEHRRAGAPVVNSELYFDYFVRGRPGYRCHLPKLVMFIDGRGYVENCLDLDHPLGNIRDMSVAEIMARPEFAALRADAERCSTCSSPTMVDISHFWEDPSLIFQSGGITVG